MNEAKLVVGIGASAGGLEPLERFFAAVPRDSGMAFVVLQHLSPDFESRMDELLARQTPLPIHKVTDGVAVEANAIYLIPPKKEMIISAGRLLLTDKDDAGISLPIDHFFRSLAHDMGRRAVAIVLSGAGSDGSRGIREIHEAGGLVLCQPPDTARFQGMPMSAQQTGVVDAFLEPDRIPEALVRYLADPLQRWDDPDHEPPELPGTTDEILRLLRTEYAIDFAHYKPSTVKRRIERRLTLTNHLDMEAYTRMLASNPEELNALYRDLLVGVTRFFRDVEAFTRLQMEVIPSILAATPPNEEIRVWVAGCATGEEAYSIAILFHEALESAGRPINLRIFATDVHRHSLDVAAAGLYDVETVSEVGARRLEKFFTRDDHRFRVIKDLRSLVVFARHNVIVDAPFTRLDLITCRNLLIYFQPLVQRKVLSLFHFGLRTGGILFLGPSETPGEVADEFDTIDSHWRVYRKRRDARLADVRLPLSVHSPSQTSRPPLSAGRALVGPQLLSIYDGLLSRVMPPSVLVDEHYQLLHTFGGAERLLHVKAGRPSTNVLDLVSEEVKAPLLGALQHAHKGRAPVRFTGIPVRESEGAEEYGLQVEPLPDTPPGQTTFVIRFERLGPIAVAQPTEVDSSEASTDYIKALESELRFTKESLQTTIEELETSNEELQATNEELVASNEELQSTNEELHSVNEELYTVNVEHQRKITQLAELTDDLDNLLHSIDIGVLFLDEHLCIRKYTAQAADVFRLLPQDVGRRFDSFAPTIQHPDLEADVNRVLQTRETLSREVTSRDGVIYLLRILPYRGVSGKRGVVITLIDVSMMRRSEAHVRRLSAIVENSGDAIVATDVSGTILDWNRGAERMFGYSTEELSGRPATVLLPEARRGEMAEMFIRLRRGESVDPIETVWVRKDGAEIDVSVRVSAVLDEHDTLVGVSTIARDITQKKRDEVEVRRALHMRDQFMAMLSHELRNPLAALLNACAILGKAEVSEERRTRALRAIERQCKHMARLLDDLLDVSRMRQDDIELRKETVDLRSTVDAALERIRPLADVAGLKIEVVLPNEEIPVFGDADRLQQVEVNLLTNAVKYTPPGKIIRLQMAAEEGQAVIRMRDEGMGIPPDMLERIFDPFVRAVDDGANGRGQGGMGLGLALVRSIVRAHGGDVRAFSDGPGTGSEFVVRLPLAESLGVPKPAQVASGGTGESVVLVEDQEDSRMLLADILSDAGYSVMPAASGKQALELIVQHRPHVALVDIGLPEMNGYDVAREVRKRMARADIFLVALTGYGQQQDRDAVLGAGFDQHLVKPIEVDTLLEVLRHRRKLRLVP